MLHFLKTKFSKHLIRKYKSSHGSANNLLIDKILLRHVYNINKGMRTLDWKNKSDDLPCILFFGLSKDYRVKIKNLLPQIRCAFNYPQNEWFDELAFMIHYPPAAVFILDTSKKEDINPQILDFLNYKKIPLIKIKGVDLLCAIAAQTNLQLLDTYFPVFCYGTAWNKPEISEITLFICDSFAAFPAMERIYPNQKLAFYLTSQGKLPQLRKFLDKFSVQNSFILGDPHLNMEMKEILKDYALHPRQLPFEENKPSEIPEGMTAVAWTEKNKDLPRVLIFGFNRNDSIKIASALPHYRCAYSSNKDWHQECAFIVNKRPVAAFGLNRGGHIINPHTKNFLEANDIPLIECGASGLVKTIAAKTHIDLLRDFFPIIFYGYAWNMEKRKDAPIILSFCSSWDLMSYFEQLQPGSRLAFCLPDKNVFDRVQKFLDYFQPESVFLLGTAVLDESVADLLRKHGLKAEKLSFNDNNSEIVEALGNKLLDDSRPPAALLNPGDDHRYDDGLGGYRLFTLKKDRSLQYLRLMNDYSLIWRGGEIPEEARAFASAYGIPLFQLSENILSRLINKNGCAAPLFEQLEADGEDFRQKLERLAASTDLRNPDLLAEAKDFLTLFREMRAWLSKSREDIFAYLKADKDSVLVLWEDDGSTSESGIADFIDKIAVNEKGKRIFCNIKSGGKNISLYDKLAFIPRQQCVFLKNDSQVDFLLPIIKTAYSSGSLRGFEALLLGVDVKTFGSPWYAGWGLTLDSDSIDSRYRLSLEQFTLLTFFYASSYNAPYTQEKLKPLEALALWYMAQRPDYSYIIEDILLPEKKRIASAPFDMRLAYYDNPSLDEKVGKLLDLSNFGALFSDLLLQRKESKSYKEFIDGIPASAAINALNSLNITAYFKANYELINDYIKKSREWFDYATLGDKEILDFYVYYKEAIFRNRFYDSRSPSFKHDNSIVNEKIYYYYIGILLYCYEYEKLIYLINILPFSFGSKFYLDVLKLLMENSNASLKEVNISKRIYLRLLVLKKCLSKIRPDLKNGFLPLFVRFMAAALMENREKMIEISESYRNSQNLELKPGDDLEKRKDEQNGIPEEFSQFIWMIADTLIANQETALALKILVNFHCGQIPAKYAGFAKQVDSSSFQSSAARIKKQGEFYSQKLRKSSDFSNKMSCSSNFALYNYYQHTSDIIQWTSEPVKRKGIIFFGYYGVFQSAILPPILKSLRNRGYSVLPIFNNHLAFPGDCRSPLGDFAYALPGGEHHLHLNWSIDFARREISALGVNFYEHFHDTVSIFLRKVEFDWNASDAQRLFQNYLKQTDDALHWIHELYKKSLSLHMPVGIMSMFAYQLPESALYDYIRSRQTPWLRFIQYKCVANFADSSNWKIDKSKVSAYDMGLYPDCRLSFIPGGSRFNPWYEARKDDPGFQERLQIIKKELSASKNGVSDQSVFEKLVAAKKAGKRVVCCIVRQLFDRAVRDDRGPCHEDMIDWVRHSIEIAARTPDILLIIRPHPLEYNAAFSVRARQRLRDLLPEELPQNVIYMDPRRIAMTSLLDILDLAVVWLGTAVYELTAFGLPVAVCSTPGSIQTPFTHIFPQSRRDYEALLRQKSWPAPDREARNRAAACLEYIRAADTKQEYPYAFVKENNTFRIVPYYHEDMLKKFLQEGDPGVEKIVDGIVEGMELYISKSGVRNEYRGYWAWLHGQTQNQVT